VDVNRFLLGEAATLAQAEGVGDHIQLQEGNAEALPFPDNSVEVAVACTVLEEGDADRMLAELVRVTRPGGRVGVLVRATDMRGWDTLPLPPAVRARAGQGGGWGAASGGCADASLYRRFRDSGLTDLQLGPQLATARTDPSLDSVRSGFESGQLASLDAEEAAVWREAAARAEAEQLLLWASPLHCAVGTKP
jgi:SAM-dependent methyltransferase